MASKGNNSGKKRKEKAILALVDKAMGRLEEQTELDAPLSFLISYFNDDTKSERERIQAAVAALPYCHEKQKVSVETTSNTNVSVSVNHKIALEHLDSLLDIKQVVDMTDIVDGELVDSDDN